MRFNRDDISPQLAQLLTARANRPDLLGGFDVDDASLVRHRAHAARAHSEKTPIARDAVAVYATLFDRDAPHAATINPMAAPVPASGSDELLKWAVSKQAETAALDRAAAETLAASIRATVHEDLAGLQAAHETHAERTILANTDAHGALKRGVQVLADRAFEQAEYLLAETRAARQDAKDQSAVASLLLSDGVKRADEHAEATVGAVEAVFASVASHGRRRRRTERTRKCTLLASPARFRRRTNERKPKRRRACSTPKSPNAGRRRARSGRRFCGVCRSRCYWRFWRRFSAEKRGRRARITWSSSCNRTAQRSARRAGCSN
jgi:hypothetical protein